MAGRPELKIIDPDVSNPYLFPVAVDGNGAKLVSLDTVTYEPGDSKDEFRVALHPWDQGLAVNRIDYKVTFNGALAQTPSRTYAKANADASWPSVLLPPPLLTELAFSGAAGASHPYTNADLVYAGAPDASIYVGPGNTVYAAAPDASIYVGANSYYAAGSSVATFYLVVRDFGGKVYLAGGQFLYSINSDYTTTLVKDFGNGKTVYDIEQFNNELVIAMGESEKLWTMTVGETFTQATDNTFAIALGRVGEYLWRAESTNRLSNCITAPRTLTSWTPASPNQYYAGDTTYSVTDLVEYLGFIVALKPDGVYFPDGETVFHNQAPQLSVYPHRDNCKGTFNAWGYLFVPSATGLLKISQGESTPIGPELSGRPDFRFWVRGGVEWSGDIYLLCTDEAAVSNTAVFKMSIIDRAVKFDELVRANSADPGYFITVSSIFTNPTCIFGHESAGAMYFKLGRGGGRHIDDPNYAWGTSWEFETGDMILGPDLGIETYLTGVEVVLDADSSEPVTAYYQVDRSGSYTELLNTQEGSGTAPITTSGFEVVRRYAAPNTSGQMFSFKLSGTLDSGSLATDRPEIREFWAIGYGAPGTTDILSVGIIADRNAKVRGIKRGKSSGELLRLFRRWRRQGTMLTLVFNDYEEVRTTRARVAEVKKENISTRVKAGDDEETTDIVTVIFKRTDFANAYADAD